MNDTERQNAESTEPSKQSDTKWVILGCGCLLVGVPVLVTLGVVLLSLERNFYLDATLENGEAKTIRGYVAKVDYDYRDLIRFYKVDLANNGGGGNRGWSHGPKDTSGERIRWVDIDALSRNEQGELRASLLNGNEVMINGDAKLDDFLLKDVSRIGVRIEWELDF